MSELTTRQQNQAKAGQTEAPAAKNTRSSGKRTAANGGADVVGPIGRVFNRILERADDARGTARSSFTEGQLKRYLKDDLKLADGEFFRGAKVSGVATELVNQLDTDRDGRVTWPEFQAFQAQILSTIAPGTTAGASANTVARASEGSFGALDQGGDGRLNYDELHEGIEGQLPAGTDHASLIAQLGARIALDAVDVDQRGSSVKDRTLSRGEWTGAAREMAG